MQSYTVRCMVFVVVTKKNTIYVDAKTAIIAYNKIPIEKHACPTVAGLQKIFLNISCWVSISGLILQELGRLLRFQVSVAPDEQSLTNAKCMSGSFMPKALIYRKLI